MKNKKLAIVLALLLSIPVVLLFSSMNRPGKKAAPPATATAVTAPVQTEETLELTDAPADVIAKMKETDSHIRFCVYRITNVFNSQPGNPLLPGSILCVYPCPPCSNPLFARVFRNGQFLCRIRAQLIAPPCSTCPFGGFYGRRIN